MRSRVPGAGYLRIAAHRKVPDSRHPAPTTQDSGLSTVALVRLDDGAFIADLEKAGAHVTTGKPKKNRDAIFYAANTRADLDRMAALRTSLVSNGALWIIRPKGVKTITESDTMAAGKAAGLVDVKVVKFSDTHSAEKYVIPVASRPRQ